MRPLFQILADGKDITPRLSERLISLSVTDDAAGQSDTLSLTIDDAGGNLLLPRMNAELELFMGYQETGLANMGRFILDEPELSGPPDKLVIRAHAADLLNYFKASRSTSWAQISIADIVATIASRYDLVPRVSEKYQLEIIEHIDQTKESDMNFLTRLATRYDAVFKPVTPYLAFVKKDQGKTASGDVLPPITLDRHQVTNYRLVFSGRSNIGYVAAYWHDRQQAKRIKELAGDEDQPGKHLKVMYPSASEAQAAAQSELAALQRGQRKLSLTLPGDPLLLAGSPLLLRDGWRDGFAGEYNVTRVEHRLGSGGYVSTISAEG